jgi:HEAT repeat protein
LIPDKEVEFLKTIVATNQYADSRIAALKRLRCVSCDEGRDVALALLNDKEAEIRNVALKVLKSCGNADNAAAVRNLLTDPEESVRVNAAATFLALSQVSKPKAKGKGK